MAVLLRGQLDDVFLDEAGMRTALGLPDDATTLFRFDHWLHPSAGERASVCRDIVLMVEALRRRRALTRLVEDVAPDHHLHERLERIGGWGDPEGWG